VTAKDNYRIHFAPHKGVRKGKTTGGVLRPHRKRASYRVEKPGAGDTTGSEIECAELDQFAAFVEKGGYLVWMKSAKPNVEGLYATEDIKVVR
jgi:hypothetical protein